MYLLKLIITEYYCSSKIGTLKVTNKLNGHKMFISFD